MVDDVAVWVQRMNADTKDVIAVFVAMFLMVFVVAFAIGLAFFCILMLMKLTGLVVVSI
jgi:hypothetical protein